MADVILPPEPNSLARRFRLRFSLRALLAVMTVLCLSLGWYYASAKRQERAVVAIEELHGRVAYDWQFDRDGKALARSPQPAGPAWLRKLLGPHYFDTVISVEISQPALNRSKPLEFSAFAGHLAKLPGLKRLSLFGVSLSDREYAMLARLGTLEVLTLGDMNVTEKGGSQIARLSKLRELSFYDDIVAAGALANIKDMPHLESLSVYCHHEDRAPNGFPIWDLEKYAIRDDALTSLPSLRRLRTLSLTFTQITDEGVAVLGRMPQLEILGMSSPQITNASMDHLTKLQNLRWLGVEVSQMDKKGVARLAELPKLTGLRISGKGVDNDCLPIIAKLSQLQDLDLGGKMIDDRGLQYLEGMKHLTHLDVQSTGITTDGPAIIRLKQALPKCGIHQYYPSPSFR
jgi:Leucine Rich Repeat (LRR) protein